ncbi:hypothetical protein H8959_012891 [Pygathrix nigripes]
MYEEGIHRQGGQGRLSGGQESGLRARGEQSHRPPWKSWRREGSGQERGQPLQLKELCLSPQGGRAARVSMPNTHLILTAAHWRRGHVCSPNVFWRISHGPVQQLTFPTEQAAPPVCPAPASCRLSAPG